MKSTTFHRRPAKYLSQRDIAFGARAGDCICIIHIELRLPRARQTPIHLSGRHLWGRRPVDDGEPRHGAGAMLDDCAGPTLTIQTEGGSSSRRRSILQGRP